MISNYEFGKIPVPTIVEQIKEAKTIGSIPEKVAYYKNHLYEADDDGTIAYIMFDCGQSATNRKLAEKLLEEEKLI